MSDRTRRIGLNEATFREVNERIEVLAETFGLADGPLDLVCECGDASCTEHIQMTRQEFEQLRSDATLFAVYPGHEHAEVEQVVDRRGGYDIVRKRSGEAAQVARETDPRD